MCDELNGHCFLCFNRHLRVNIRMFDIDHIIPEAFNEAGHEEYL